MLNPRPKTKIIVVVEPADYSMIIEELRNLGDVSFLNATTLLWRLFHTLPTMIVLSATPAGAEGKTCAISNWFALPFTKIQDLRYGKTPPRASFYSDPLPEKSSVAVAKQLQGKELSFNNINDLNAAWELLKEFSEPTAVAVKHTNPCGVGSADNIEEAYRKAYDSDPVSIFGGIVALNREVDGETARMMAKIFLEVIAAPSFSKEALECFHKKDVRLLEIDLDSPENQEKGLTLKSQWRASFTG